MEKQIDIEKVETIETPDPKQEGISDDEDTQPFTGTEPSPTIGCSGEKRPSLLMANVTTNKLEIKGATRGTGINQNYAQTSRFEDASTDNNTPFTVSTQPDGSSSGDLTNVKRGRLSTNLLIQPTQSQKQIVCQNLDGDGAEEVVKDKPLSDDGEAGARKDNLDDGLFLLEPREPQNLGSARNKTVKHDESLVQISKPLSSYQITEEKKMEPTRLGLPLMNNFLKLETKANESLTPRSGNSISSLIRAKQQNQNKNSRLSKMGRSLALAPSRLDLISAMSKECTILYNKSQEKPFSDKYFYFNQDKLGQGAHATVYRCYLNKDKPAVEAFKQQLKRMGFERKSTLEGIDLESLKENDGLSSSLKKSDLNRIDEITEEEVTPQPDLFSPVDKSVRESNESPFNNVSSESCSPDQKKPTLDSNIQVYAVKVVRDNDQEKLRAHENEFKILSMLNHPNIVGSVEMFKDVFKNEVYQVMECINGSEILDEIAKMGKYDEATAKDLFKQILEGIEYMHKSRVCHRDIKPSNVLITKDKRVYIADFNVAKYVALDGDGQSSNGEKRSSLLQDQSQRGNSNISQSDKGKETFLRPVPETDAGKEEDQKLNQEPTFLKKLASTPAKSKKSNSSGLQLVTNAADLAAAAKGGQFVMHTRTAGTLAFAAPERIKDNCIYTEKVDLWSAGIVLFMVLTGQHPFDMMIPQSAQNLQTSELFRQIENCEEFAHKFMQECSYVSQDAKDLVCKLIVSDPVERLSATEALAQPWFSSSSRESCTCLTLAQSGMKERLVRKSMGNQVTTYERVPMAAIRTELLRGGLEIGNQSMMMHRSYSMSSHKNQFYDSFAKLKGRRQPIGSVGAFNASVSKPRQANDNKDSSDASQNNQKNSIPFDQSSPEKGESIRAQLDLTQRAQGSSQSGSGVGSKESHQTKISLGGVSNDRIFNSPPQLKANESRFTEHTDESQKQSSHVEIKVNVARMNNQLKVSDILRPKSGRTSASPRDFSRIQGDPHGKEENEEEKNGVDPFAEASQEEEETISKPIQKKNSRKLFQSVGRCRSEFYESVPEPEYVKKQSERELLAKQQEQQAKGRDDGDTSSDSFESDEDIDRGTEEHSINIDVLATDSVKDKIQTIKANMTMPEINEEEEK